MPMPTQTFAAIGDPVRLTIVDRLAESDATVGELAGLFEISFQAVSQHLDVLERAGVISRHREGRTRRVRLHPEPLDEAAAWMDARRRRLEARYARLDDVLAALATSAQTDRIDEGEPHGHP
ncbi:ArsR/SmtB family transcription factor [Microbacterium rhizosphaerae]|uniref:Metalloregulator ArsR/SmtB family transcription factor n=1 Tax=Microbacterium rhizosphaerae TaxID=1678237 RepID=A0ABZ0SK72_9MICO|nr:metalloregulator ArsR/SmtB family transcription factor [Microbacterium rhizosphaerae]WPR88565.1 metalloregulator ArsR/SmtB family transcription factor [Microbacterium rhizosphaerae]